MKLFFTITILLFSKPIFSQFNYESSSQIEQKYRIDTLPGTYQRLAWYFSTIDNYYKALEYWDKQEHTFNQNTKFDSILQHGKYVPCNASEIIIHEAKNTNIILINEAHHVPYHRTFTSSLLKDLYKNGYRYLGCEGLSKYDSLINNRKFPTKKSGYYVRNPEFGALLREAIKIGFTVFGYDSQAANFDEREKEQAKSILEMYRKGNGKMLIHAGYSHIREDSLKRKRMGFYLKKFVQEDILTIDQTYFLEHLDSNLNKYPFTTINFNSPTIILNKDSTKNIDNSNGTDFIVIHPKANFSKKRLWYINYSKNKKEYYLSANEYKKKQLILAYVYDEYKMDIDAIPADIIELNGDGKQIPLYLLKGKYLIKKTDSNSKITLEKILIK